MVSTLGLEVVAVLVQFYVLNISDIISTWIGLRAFGLVEVNPLGKWLFATFGITKGGLLLKVPYLLAATYAAFAYETQTFYSLLVWDVIFVFVILNNLMQSAIAAGYWNNPELGKK